MIEYIYKGFKISYNISSKNTENHAFQADGSMTYLLNTPKSFVPKTFHTESVSHNDAEDAIKQLLENHIDLELKHFYSKSRAPISIAG